MTKKLIIFTFLFIFISMIFVSAQDREYILKKKGIEETEFFCKEVPIGEIYDPEILLGKTNKKEGPDDCVDCKLYDSGGVFFRSEGLNKFRSNICESATKLKVFKCSEIEEILTNFGIVDCGKNEICIGSFATGGKCVEIGECPSKIEWDTTGSIISQGHYPSVFLKTYNTAGKPTESVILYEEYFNSEMVRNGGLMIPEEGIKVVGGEELREFIEENNLGSYQITYKSPIEGCETEETIEFTIKESMSITDRISEFFKWLF